MTDDARIKARYPRRTATDYLLFIVALIALVGTIVFVAITGAQRSNPPVAGMVRSFEVVSPTQISAEIVVQRTVPSDSAECELFAQALSYEKVAETIIEILPARRNSLEWSSRSTPSRSRRPSPSSDATSSSPLNVLRGASLSSPRETGCVPHMVFPRVEVIRRGVGSRPGWVASGGLVLRGGGSYGRRGG